jgi:hypothetical protein
MVRSSETLAIYLDASSEPIKSNETENRNVVSYPNPFSSPEPTVATEEQIADTIESALTSDVGAHLGSDTLNKDGVHAVDEASQEDVPRDNDIDMSTSDGDNRSMGYHNINVLTYSLTLMHVLQVRSLRG